MNSKTSVQTVNKTVSLSAQAINDLIVDSIQDIKGKNILKLDLRKLRDTPCDYFIICEGDSNTQVRAISENIQRRLRDETNTKPVKTEGTTNSLWVCMDYFDTIVHIFYRETRAFYELEELWSDAEFTEYANI